jgi:hypothetical protein
MAPSGHIAARLLRTEVPSLNHGPISEMVLYISDLIPKSWGQFGSGKKIQQLSVKGYFTYAVHRREKSYILHSITPGFMAKHF